MIKGKPKRIFKAWVLEKRNGKILLGIDGLPIMCLTQSAAKYFLGRLNKHSTLKRVTIIVED